MTDVLGLAAEFHAWPVGRDDRDGSWNGTRFREEILLPRLRAAIDRDSILVVDLAGVRCFGSGFFEEAFGGLLRQGISPEEIERHLEVRSDRPAHGRHVEAIRRYMRAAAERRGTGGQARLGPRPSTPFAAKGPRPGMPTGERP